eukprot:TRINITY_DN3203_c0_g1_i2.p1 TRINITY_DN3203_c0_g1~~TRINITY_DN3203_c0_g1_i2.p1  ORF type:complete len:357 (+),score=33.89 TRINITY_DN3203_c0_g1_i2:602-1672(+)
MDPLPRGLYGFTLGVAMAAIAVALVALTNWSPSYTSALFVAPTHTHTRPRHTTGISRSLLPPHPAHLLPHNELQAGPKVSPGVSGYGAGVPVDRRPAWLVSLVIPCVAAITWMAAVTWMAASNLSWTKAPQWQCCAATGVSEAVTKTPEDELVALLGSYDGKDPAAEGRILSLVQELCASQFSSVDVVGDPRINGIWRLRFTSKSKFDIRNPLGSRVDGSKPGLEALFAGGSAAPSSSPIQRAVTTLAYDPAGAVRIYQNIAITGADPRVDQLVYVGGGSDPLLRLSASARPKPPKRLDFTFDLAYFLVLGIRIPYPVPFRLLGSEAQGYLDTEYLSNGLRITRGNKGTTFVLVRE